MKAVILTRNSYPCGDAGAVRQHAMAKMLQELEYDVFVIGYGKTDEKQIQTYEGVDYVSLRLECRNKVEALYSMLFFGNRAISYLKERKEKIDLLLVVDMMPYDFGLINKYADKNGIKLFHDSVEWYSPEEFKNGKKNIFYQMKEYTNRKAIRGKWRVIAISQFLKEHFEKQCDKAVRIPVIMDVKAIAPNLEIPRKGKTVYVYAGSPEGKDYLKEILEGFSLLDRQRLDNVEIHIIGVNKEQLIERCAVKADVLETLGNVLIAHGRVPREEVVEWVKRADFSLLLRNAELRYAKAGFPTKVVESLSCGTPPLCNLSSDLGLYLQNQVNAVLIEECSAESVKDALLVSLDMGEERRKKLRLEARRLAEECFDFRQYIDDLAELVAE